MILKIFKAVWFLSLLALLATFLFIYAAVPERLVVNEGSSMMTISREALFYSSLTVFAICNVLVFIMSSLFKATKEEFLTWFYGQVIALNIFFIISMNFINLYNSSEKFDYARIGYVIYGSVVLVVLWAAAWPVYLIFRKKITKPTV